MLYSLPMRNERDPLTYFDDLPPLGTPEFDNAYYQTMGEKRLLGDLSNVAISLSPFALQHYGPKLPQEPATLPGIKSFLGIMRKVADGTDTLYSPQTRAFTRNLLDQQKALIEETLQSPSLNFDQLKTLKKDIRDQWQKYAYEKMTKE